MGERADLGSDLARQTGAACFVLPIHNGRVLLARHSYRFETSWLMVGGMAEAGEPVDVAARREALEETGLQVSTDALVAVADRRTLIMFVFAGRVTGGVESPQTEEIAELRWFAADDLSDPAVFDLARRVAGPLLRADGGLRDTSVRWLDDSTAQCWVSA